MRLFVSALALHDADLEAWSAEIILHEANFFYHPYTTWRGMESSRLSLPLPSSQQFTADAPQDPEFASEPESSLESSSELPVTERIIDPNVIDHTRIEPDEDFIGDCIQRFRAFLLGLAPLAPLAARIGSGALPRVVILNALRMMTSDMTLRIIIGDPPAGDTPVKALAAEHGVNLGELSAGEQIRCAKWLELFGLYFADQEIAC